MVKKELIPVIKALLEDDEFLAGGIFTKEKEYMKKYNLTQNQMNELCAHLYFALHIKTNEGRLK